MYQTIFRGQLSNTQIYINKYKMIIGSQCTTDDCQGRPKYYCCSPELPACSDCSDKLCKKCERKRNKPLKALQKVKTVNISPEYTQKADRGILTSNQSLKKYKEKQQSQKGESPKKEPQILNVATKLVDDCSKERPNQLQCWCCSNRLIQKQKCDQERITLCKECISKDQDVWQNSKTRSINKKDKGHKKKQDLRVQNEIQGFHNFHDNLYVCMICDRKQPTSLTSTVSLDIGNHICSLCLQQQQQLINLSTQKNYRSDPLYLNYLQPSKDYKPFGKNILLNSQSPLNLSQNKVQRGVVASIIQQHPDPVEIDLFNDPVTYISCFKCGYFIPSDVILVHQMGKLCLKCFLSSSAQKR